MIDCQLPDKVPLSSVSGAELTLSWCNQGGSVGKVRLGLGFEGWKRLGKVGRVEARPGEERQKSTELFKGQ